MRSYASRLRIIAGLALLTMIFPLTALWAAPVSAQADWAPPRTVYIPETGHTIDGVFLDVWRDWGGASAFGYPITPEFEENGHIVQYYGYARFEYWPEDPNGNVVHFGAIGTELKPYLLADLQQEARGAGTARAEARGQAKQALLAFEPLDPTRVRPDSAIRHFAPATNHSVAGGFRAYWEALGGEANLGNPLTELYDLDGTTYQLFERGLVAWQPGGQPWLEPAGKLLADYRQLNQAPVAQGSVPTYSEALFVPPPPPPPPAAGPQPRQADPNAERWIEVNLSTQYMIAWQGDVPVMESYVSTGRPGFDTPPGSYRVIVKKPIEDMEGVIGGEYYNVPDVPHVLYFTNVGHAIHGTYWHNNFGAVMSHGCVNLPMGVAEWIYNWAPMGTRVEIHY